MEKKVGLFPAPWHNLWHNLLYLLQDCSLLGGRDCDAGTAFLQTKSAYRSLGATDMAPSFFQTAEEAQGKVLGL